MPKRLLSYDPISGMKTWHEYDHENKTTSIGYEQEGLDYLLDYNREMEGQIDSTYKRKKEFWHAATLPEWIIMKWRSEGIDVFNPKDYDRVRRKLNDPDYKWLRTWKGRI